MSNVDIIRAWKDAVYRASLSVEEQALLPDNPVGTPLSDEELEQVSGASITTVSTVTITTTLIPTTEWTATTIGTVFM